MFRCLIVIWLFFSPIILAKTVIPQNPSNESKPILVEAKHPTFTVILASNPTTGYRWFIRSYPPDFIVPIKHSIIKSTAKLMGAPTQEVFVFKLNKVAFNAPHQFQIRFTYLRPFERSAKTDNKTFLIITTNHPEENN